MRKCSCGGDIKDVKIVEDGVATIHEICQKCGRDDSLDPMVLYSEPAPGAVIYQGGLFTFLD